MAVAVLIFSNGDPLLVLAGCLLFGFSDALAVRLQIFDIPSYVVQTVPYLVTLAFLFIFAYRSRPRVFRELFDKVRPATPK